MRLDGACRSAENVPRWFRIPTIQGLLGHKGVSTVMIYTHVLHCGQASVRSRLDGM